MVKKRAKNINELERLVIAKLKKALDNPNSHTAYEIKSAQQRAVEEVVYNSYTPLKYERRGSSGGGLGDMENMNVFTEAQYSRQVKLMIKNVTQSNPNVDYTAGVVPPDYLAGIIEYGRDKGLYSQNRYGTESRYMKPRPFIKKTMLDLSQTKAHVKGLSRDLKSVGVKARKI